jgi:hypothetical protein
MKIEKNIPLPQYNWYQAKIDKYDEIAKKMEIGDSVLFHETENFGCTNKEALKLFNKIKKIYGKGSARTASFVETYEPYKKATRVWRIK